MNNNNEKQNAINNTDDLFSADNASAGKTKKTKAQKKAEKEKMMKAAKADKNKNGPSLEEVASTIGRKRSFAMAEAHKRLRTNIMFSFADDSECHIIGVTSAMAHEGKTTTSINLAYDLMKAGKRTLLIDADMRMSRVPKLLEVEATPGLSNILVGKGDNINAVRASVLHDGLQVIPCGDIPPNPTELLSSKRFEILLNAFKETYEYIVIDLPPVAEVSDALIASKLVDGMIVVVRQEYVDKRLLDDTIHQLNLSGARIIGLVLTCAQYKTKYGKYKYKKSGGYKYSRGSYGYGYGKHSGYYSRGAHRHHSGYGYGYGYAYEQQYNRKHDSGHSSGRDSHGTHKDS
ncbi:MAG: CpsD/CapB family tyrosine-protein kinase [Clostridia bacterium]|nr:CpsD/CapB family tyrosine-protein kinase [Clostridia bacterium]